MCSSKRVRSPWLECSKEEEWREWGSKPVKRLLSNLIKGGENINQVKYTNWKLTSCQSVCYRIIEHDRWRENYPVRWSLVTFCFIFLLLVLVKFQVHITKVEVVLCSGFLTMNVVAFITMLHTENCAFHFITQVANFPHLNFNSTFTWYWKIVVYSSPQVHVLN